MTMFVSGFFYFFLHFDFVSTLLIVALSVFSPFLKKLVLLCFWRNLVPLLLPVLTAFEVRLKHVPPMPAGCSVFKRQLGDMLIPYQKQDKFFVTTWC